MIGDFGDIVGIGGELQFVVGGEIGVAASLSSIIVIVVKICWVDW